eukprot:UN05725
MWFKDGSWATLDYGVESAHRSYWNMCTVDETITVEDLVGGQGLTGNFNAYLKILRGAITIKQRMQKGKKQL